MFVSVRFSQLICLLQVKFRPIFLSSHIEKISQDNNSLYKFHFLYNVSLDNLTRIEQG